MAIGTKGLKDVIKSGRFAEVAKGAAEAVSKIKAAIKSSVNDLNSVITKIYSRTDAVLDAEFAVYGRLRFEEAKILEDADQICSDRYANWIKGKLAESGTLLSKEGKFIDTALEEDYAMYLSRKAKEGKTPKDRLDWKEARDYWLNDSPMARGNAFNKKAGKLYKYNEVNLSHPDGSRTVLDSYDPDKGEIISRKATDLDMIQLDTYEKYLKEMGKKYQPGTLIRSNTHPKIDGQRLIGKQILEIPASNKGISNIQEYIDLAKNKYNIELRFTEE